MATLLKKIGVDSKYLEARQKAKEESKKQKEEEKKQKKLEKEEKKRRKAAKDALGSEPPVEGETASSLSDQPPPAKIEIDEFDDIDSDPPSEEEEDNTPAASRRSSRQVEAVASGARGPQTLLEKKYHVEALEKKVERLSTEQLQLESELARKEEEFKAQQEADRRQLEEERRLAHKQREEDKARRLAEEEAAKKAEQERLANLSGFLSKKGASQHISRVFLHDLLVFLVFWLTRGVLFAFRAQVMFATTGRHGGASLSLFSPLQILLFFWFLVIFSSPTLVAALFLSCVLSPD